MSKSDATSLFEDFGIALIILAIFLGLSHCVKSLSYDGTAIEKEKTKQLQLKLEIEKAKQ